MEFRNCRTHFGIAWNWRRIAARIAELPPQRLEHTIDYGIVFSGTRGPQTADGALTTPQWVTEDANRLAWHAYCVLTSTSLLSRDVAERPMTRTYFGRAKGTCTLPANDTRSTPPLFFGRGRVVNLCNRRETAPRWQDARYKLNASGSSPAGSFFWCCGATNR